MDQDKIERYHRVYLRTLSADASIKEKKEALLKKQRRVRLTLLLNVAAVLLFGYSFIAGISNLSQNVMIAIGILFLVNLGLMSMQLNQIKEFFEYLTNNN